MGFKKQESKKNHTGLKPGTPVTLFNGKQGFVIHSDKSYTTIRESEYKEFDSDVSMPTAQAKQLIKKTK